MTKTLTSKELELLKKCDGKHSTLKELFACTSCDVLFNNSSGIPKGKTKSFKSRQSALHKFLTSGR